MADIIIFILGVIFGGLVLVMILHMDYVAFEEQNGDRQSDDFGKEDHEQFYELDRR